MNYQHSDYGNATRLIDLYGQSMRFSPTAGWLVWNGRVWQRSYEAAMNLAAISAATISENTNDPPTLKWGLSSLSTQHLLGALKLATSFPNVTTQLSEFDTNPNLINLPNGVLDLTSGELLDHDPKYMMTQITNIPLNPEAKAPRWDQFLNEIMNDDIDMIRSLQQIAGYSLTGHTSERCMFILYGFGANGKSSFVDALAHVLGDYAKAIPSASLMRKGFGSQSIPNDIAMLKGSRLAYAAEADSHHQLSEALIKNVTGDNVLTARFLHHEFFQFKPAFKLMLATNHKPRIRGTDNAIWTRIRLVPFTVEISEEKRDPKLLEKLLAEAEGVLLWALMGALAFLKDHEMHLSTQIERETLAYRSNQDIVGQFIDDCIMAFPGSTLAKSTMYKTYTEWCTENGLRPATKLALGNALIERGFKEVRTGRSRCWNNINIVAHATEPQTEEPETARDLF